MAHPREEVQAAVDRYVTLRHSIEDAAEMDFSVLGELYSDDAVYYDASWGRIEGREAITDWFSYSMVGLEDWDFPVEFTAIEGDNVIVKWTQYSPGTRNDGSRCAQSGYSWLIYAGGGKFSYEEDCYNMVHVLEDLGESGWAPTKPMNVPPAKPDRNWQPPTTTTQG